MNLSVTCNLVLKRLQSSTEPEAKIAAPAWAEAMKGAEIEHVIWTGVSDSIHLFRIGDDTKGLIRASGASAKLKADAENVVDIAITDVEREMLEREQEEQRERSRRWNEWRDGVFTEVDKTLGPSGSRGAMRFYGDLQISVEATNAIGIATLWVSTNANKPLPLIGYETQCEWDDTKAHVAAASLLQMVKKIEQNPMYVRSKKSAHED